MVDRIIIDDTATGDAAETNRPLIQASGWLDWVPSFGLGSSKKGGNPFSELAQDASKKLDEDLNSSTGRTSASMLAAIDAYAKIPVNTPEGAYMWSHENPDKTKGGIIQDWKLQCEKNKYTNVAVRGSAILFTAEGENQLKAGSLVPDVSPYDMRLRGEPLYVLSNYKNGDPIGYDLGSTGLMSLYEAKRDIQINSDDPVVSAQEKEGLKPVMTHVIDDIRDVVDAKHNMPEIISQLSEKHYPQDGYGRWKQYILNNVMPMVDKSAWTEGVDVGGQKLHPINTFMRDQFVAKTWRDLTTLDLAEIDHSLKVADTTHDPDAATAQRMNAINTFLGVDGGRVVDGYKGVRYAIGVARDKGGQNNPDTIQLIQQAQVYGQKLEQYLEKISTTNPQEYTKQLQLVKLQLSEMQKLQR